MKKRLTHFMLAVFCCSQLTSCMVAAVGAASHIHKKQSERMGYYYDKKTGVVSIDNEPKYLLKKYANGTEASLYSLDAENELVYFSYEYRYHWYTKKTTTIDERGRERTTYSDVATPYYFVKVVFLGTGKEIEMPRMGWRDLVMIMHDNKVVVDGKLNDAGINRVFEKYD